MTSQTRGTARKSSRREHIELSTKIQEWASNTGLLDSNKISDLCGDIEARENFAYWASLEASDLLPELPSKRARKFRIWYQRIAFSRNLLIFLPVTITWIAIAESSSAFSRYISENPGALVNFLQFWQDGYGYLAPFWRLSNIAMIDFFILLLIMILTTVLQLMNTRAEKSDKQATEEFSSSRERLSREVYEFFQRNQRVTPLTVDRVLSSALRDLSKSAYNLERLTKELSRSVRGFPSYIETIKEVRTLKNSLNRLEKRDK